MTAFSQLLLEDCAGKDCPTCTDFKRRIEESARRMDRLTLDLLAYSRLSREEFTLQPVELGILVEKARGSLEKSLGERKGSLEIRGSMPTVMGQEFLLAQVLENLLSNAFKFVAAGVPPRVIVTAERRGSSVRLWIEDNGIGIPAEYHDRIFGIFERLNRSEDYPGTGIGLAIVRRVVQRMGGVTGFESQVNQGSRFWIELKAA
jgi:signal transduction histidine kinase